MENYPPFPYVVFSWEAAELIACGPRKYRLFHKVNDFDYAQIAVFKDPTYAYQYSLDEGFIGK